MKNLILTICTALFCLAGAASTAQAEPSHIPQTVGSNEAIGTDRVEVSKGHIDLGPRIVDGEWRFLGRDDTVSPPVWRHLQDLIMRVNDQAKLEVPDDPNYAFLPKGKKVWVVPQTQDQNVVWVGWSTQDPAVVDKLDRGGWLELKGVDGPGRLVTFLANGFEAPTQLWDSAKGAGQRFWLNSNTHTHLNWVFEAAGQYVVTIDFVGKAKDGAEVRVPATLIYLVGNGTKLGAVPTSAPIAQPAPAASAPPSGVSIGWWVIGGVGALLVVLIAVRVIGASRARKEVADDVRD